MDYAGAGWPVCLAHICVRSGHAIRCTARCRAGGCLTRAAPAPATGSAARRRARIRSRPAWQLEAAAIPGTAGRWWRAQPEANVILVTGRVFDVLDVPAAAGTAALARMEPAGVRTGPVALSPAAGADDRALFFVATRGAAGGRGRVVVLPPGLRAGRASRRSPACAGTARDSYVVAPPSRSGRRAAQWLREPREQPLPDALRLLEFLADACEEVPG